MFLIEIECPALSDPENGRVHIIPNGNAATAVFTCNNGFVIIGNLYSKCKNGKWTSPPSKCQAA